MGKVTIIDIANRAGVSFKTVSRVLNNHPGVGDALCRRVEAAMLELDYRPNRAARSLKGSRNFSIGLLVGAGQGVSLDDARGSGSPYLAEVQRGILRACRDGDYNLVVDWVDLGSPTMEPDLRKQLQHLNVDGVVLIPPLSDTGPLLETLDSLGIRYARIAPGIDPGRSFGVAIDDRAAALAMTRHLQELGHSRIAFICGPSGHIAAGERLTGYKDAIGSEPMIATGDFSFESGMAAASDLLRGSPRPTAIFAANDDMAAGVLAAAQTAGLKVPDDLSVAGFDDAATARLVWPSLTTVHQPIALMSARATEHLIAASASREPLEPALVQLPFEIVIRRSASSP